MSKALSFLAFNDPLFSKQWHLNNTGQLQGAEIGEDINVTFVWPDYTGRGIVVGIVDDGFDVTHPDLVSNYNFDLSWDFVEGKIGGITTSSDDDHGTSVAGLIASTANNEIGGVGVAWNASLIGYRFLEETSNSTIATRFVEVGERALSAKIDILNNSWGPMLDPFDNQDYQQTYWNVARDLVSSGRDGLGTIILFAAGNNRKDQMNTNYDPTDNLPYAIIVAASEPNGAVTDFSTPGSSILITAPGSYTYTTDLQSTWGTNKLPGVAGNYADSPETRFSGTSAATPIAAGVVALMLEANPGLGYRDVQEILVYSARSGLFLNDEGAQINGAKNWNGGGLVTSHDFGFGNIDARQAIRLAETWHKKSTIENMARLDGRIETSNLSVEPGSEAFASAFFNSSNSVEQINVAIDLDASQLEDVTLELISPNGTKSILFNNPPNDQGPLPDTLTYTLNSVRHWGEALKGEWRLKLTNDASGSTVTLNSWSIQAFAGDIASSQTQIFTDEFSVFSAFNADRTQIKSSNGKDLNAASVSKDILFDLSGGSSKIGDVMIQLDDPTIFRNLISGDGDDRLIGNAIDNYLLGGRGNNIIDGGQGTDIAAFIGDVKFYDVELFEQGFRVTSKNLSGGGVDIITNVEKFQFGSLILPSLSALDETQIVASLYDALFDRAPDVIGLEAWSDALHADHISEKDVALGFIQSGEAMANEMSDETFMVQLYRSALERDPDMAGLLAWSNALSNGSIDRADVLLAFIQSNEYQEAMISLVVQDLSNLGDFWT